MIGPSYLLLLMDFSADLRSRRPALDFFSPQLLTSQKPLTLFGPNFRRYKATKSATCEAEYGRPWRYTI